MHTCSLRRRLAKEPVSVLHKNYYLSVIPASRRTPLICIGIEGWVPGTRFRPITDMHKTHPKRPRDEATQHEKVVQRKVPRITEQPATKIAMTTEEYNSYLTAKLRYDKGIPSEIPVKDTIGKSHLGLMCPQLPYAVGHDAIPLLQGYSNDGCPVDCGEDWLAEHIELMLERGPHRSAMGKQAVRQLRKETEDKVKHSYARVVKWGDIKKNIPPRLKISPVAMIPHKSKLFRCILDLSFILFHNGVKYSSVNERTRKMARPEAMAQLGKVVRRIIQLMAEQQHHGHPFKFTKLDVKDGFWRMAVANDDAWNFCYVLPSLQERKSLDDIEIVVPNSLQMGWCESPPFFCSGSETARDIMETMRLQDLPPHKFEEVMLQKVDETDTTKHTTGLVTLLEVYVDDFIAVSNDIRHAQLRQLSRTMLHGIHAIFPPPEVTGHTGHDPIAYKKLIQGDGIWDVFKEILGWDFDGVAYTIQLPAKKCSDICTLMRKLLKKKRVALNQFQKLAGKLQHASLAIPSGRSLFTPLDMAMRNDPDVIIIDETLRQCLEDWRCLVQCMAREPTSVRLLVMCPPTYISYTDACKLGAGGVWCSGIKTLKPFLWQVEWPKDIQDSLVTVENPNGSVTINDLELAGALLGFLVLESSGVALQYCHLATFCDNMTTVVWAYKLRNSKSRIAGYLLRFLGLRMHQAQCSSMVPHHIAGENNIMADIISRAFKHGKIFELANDLVSYFDKRFPLVQNESWHECQVPTDLLSSVTACLRGKLLPMASLLRQTPRDKNIGAIGNNTLTQQISTRSLILPSLPLNVTLSQEHLLLGSGRGSTETEINSKFQESRMPSRPSPRPLSWLENPVSSIELKTNTSSTLNV